jgi:hypothetical protein
MNKNDNHNICLDPKYGPGQRDITAEMRTKSFCAMQKDFFILSTFNKEVDSKTFAVKARK